MMTLDDAAQAAYVREACAEVFKCSVSVAHYKDSSLFIAFLESRVRGLSHALYVTLSQDVWLAQFDDRHTKARHRDLRTALESAAMLFSQQYGDAR